VKRTDREKARNPAFYVRRLVAAWKIVIAFGLIGLAGTLWSFAGVFVMYGVPVVFIEATRSLLRVLAILTGMFGVLVILWTYESLLRERS
jgi:predicted anti-sigma-YlaC factor YlaD